MVPPGRDQYADREALARKRLVAAEHPVTRPVLAISAAGSALWFAAAARPREAGELLREAAAISAGLEGVGSPSGVYHSVQAAHFARSGVQAEPVAPGERRQPMLGQSLYHCSFSVRESYRAGVALTGQAMARLVIGDNAGAAGSLDEAVGLLLVSGGRPEPAQPVIDQRGGHDQVARARRIAGAFVADLPAC